MSYTATANCYCQLPLPTTAFRCQLLALINYFRRMIQAVIFDMDGLLVDSEPWWRVAETNVFGKLSAAPSEAEFEKMMGNRIEEVIRQWHEQHPWEGVSFDETKSLIVDEVDRLVKTHAGLLPGVNETLRFFHEQQVPVALASSSPLRLIRSLMTHYRLADAFHIMCSAEQEPFGKPHPAVFLTTAKQLDVNPLHCLVLEDSFNGVIAAKAARMKCIAVPAPEAFAQPRFDIADVKLRSLDEFDAATWKTLNT